MADPTYEEVMAFLEDLNKVSNKHRIAVYGCGCCGSPFLARTERDGRYTIYELDYLNFKESNQ